MILAMDRIIEKTRHKVIIPDLGRDRRMGDKTLSVIYHFILSDLRTGTLWT